MDNATAYADTPEGWHQRWTLEFSKADKDQAEWHASAEVCTDRYLDEARPDGAGERLNLYSANVNTQDAMLYGQTPKVDVARKFADQADDVGRVAGECLQRVLNGDMERAEDGFRTALRACLSDRLLAGYLGGIVFDYVQTPDGGEDVEAQYFHWKDQKWSPCRIFTQCRWWAFRTLLGREAIVEKFGEEAAKSIPFTVKEGEQDSPPTPWDRAEVWRIFDKEHKSWWWYPKGGTRMVTPVGAAKAAKPNGSVPDPLGIRGFWPFAEPKMANATSRKFIPRPDFALAQDRYNAIDDETNRIAILRDALKVACVYDPNVGEFAQIFRSKGNVAIPAENYAALSEKQGLAGSVSWWDLSAIVAALQELRELRQEDISLLFQETGWSDIMRGQSSGPRVTAREQSIKAQFGSVRIQKSQDEFAAYASDAQRVRGEIVCKHFQPDTIALRANVQGMPQADQVLAEEAVALLKQDISCYRIVVKSEAISMTDYAANKQEAMDVLGTIGTYMQAVEGLAQSAPMLAPTLLEILQALVARVKGGDAIESALDQAITKAQQMAEQAAQQQQGPSPEQQAEMLKLEGVKAKAQADGAKANAQMAKAGMDMQVAKVKTGLELRKLAAETQAHQIESAIRIREAQAADEPEGAPA